MIIKGEVNVYWDGFYADRLVMNVKFRLPKHLFKEKLGEVLEDMRWIGNSDGYDDESEFWESCLETLGNRTNLEEMAKSMIINHLKTKYSETEKDKKKIELEKLITTVNQNFVVEIDYNRSK